MRTTFAAIGLAIISLIFYSGSGAAQTTGAQDLQQYVSELQKSPGDMVLREKIVAAARDANPAPPISEEARRHYVVARTFFEGARKPADFIPAIGEFKRALLVAPWWADANRDLGLALENAGNFDEAIAFIRLYIACNPGEDRARAAQDEIYKIEAKKELAAREARELKAAREEESRKAAEDARAKAALAQLESPEGTWCYFFWGRCMPDSAGLMVIRSTGGQWTITFPNWNRMYATDIRQGGRRITFTRMVSGADPELNTDYVDLTLSPDGKELNGSIRSVSIAGNRPHWTTDSTKYIRQ
jgi:tetratricopeptide (TPR) repeat protein